MSETNNPNDAIAVFISEMTGIANENVGKITTDLFDAIKNSLGDADANGEAEINYPKATQAIIALAESDPDTLKILAFNMIQFALLSSRLAMQQTAPEQSGSRIIPVQ